MTSHMARAFSQVEQDVLALTNQERARLLRTLIRELDAPVDSGVEEAWMAESERRLAQAEDGSATLYAADEVLKEARARLK